MKDGDSHYIVMIELLLIYRCTKSDFNKSILIKLEKIEYNKLIPVLAILAGASFLISGITIIIFYIVSLFSVINEPDKSLIFWYLPLLFFGLILLVAGIFYLIEGIKSRKGDETAYRYSRYMLIIAGILISAIVLLGLLNNFILNI